MGLVILPKVSLYWSKCKIYSNPFVSDTIDLERFKHISRMLHFGNNDLPQSSRNFRTQPLIDMLLEIYQTICISPDNLAIDE